MDDINKLIEILKNFEQEHRDLDEILIRLQEKNTVDFLQIQRLKKRKLILKLFFQPGASMKLIKLNNLGT